MRESRHQNASVCTTRCSGIRKGDIKMKRTYVDVIGEYYDNLDDLIVDANRFGVKGADLIKVLSGGFKPMMCVYMIHCWLLSLIYC